MIADVHCHLHEYSDKDLETFTKLNMFIIAVSDDYNSSLKTLNISKKYSWVIPALGIHPWSIKDTSIDEARIIAELIMKNGIRIIGEVGLDTKFVPNTIKYQREVFKYFLELASEFKLSMNLHTPNTWSEVFKLILQYDIPTAIFHWYTGPQHLLKEFEAHNMFISINPAITIQKKHREIARKAPMDIILIESDGPYNYRGLNLGPHMVNDTIEYLAKLKEVDIEEFIKHLENNFAKFIKLSGFKITLNLKITLNQLYIGE